MYAELIVDIKSEALDRAYTYLVPEGMELAPGDKVSVPFGRQEKTAYVLSLSEETDYDAGKIREIRSKVEGAVSVKEQLLALAVWMSEEYGTTLNQCLKTVLPVKRTVRKNRRRVDPLLRYHGTEEIPKLNPEQEAALSELREGYRRCFSEEREERKEGEDPPSYLLFGVTGSGKTEVYLRILEEVIQSGRQAILLIPEISLTYQTVLRVSGRFQGRTAILHSRMSLGERYEQYLRCERGEVDILIGPRSAVFAPFSGLGLIIMDEEQEGAYKSETAPCYETREVAEKRAELSGCPILYGSATPSLTIYRAALSGRPRLLRLKKRAVPGSCLPKTEIVDLRRELSEGNRSVFSRRLRELMEEKLSLGEQIMLFMNRRGYSSFVSCRSCGEAIRCPHCDVSLTLHRDGRLRCHYCGYELPLMKSCPSCGSPYLAPFGTGTEKLESLCQKEFPGARLLRMDRDTTGRKGGYEEILERFRNREADILIGTQMIVKGHDFPGVTLVGVIAADLSLFSPDFRSQEKTFQLLTQAAGRAGRGENPGTVVIQSYQPEHYAIVLSMRQDYELFYEKELAFREMMGYPPCSRLLTIRLSSADESFLEAVSSQSFSRFESRARDAGAELIGPLNAPLYKLKDIFRKIIYIKHESHDIIIKLRKDFAKTVRSFDRRGLILLHYDLIQ
ncbi:primosomal protein N' [Oribacterium sp. oral taxon 078 str. F0262]|uniref:replication restart helicase PriA n=1 Tax=Oribacterium sp. oral taxon 078 TaxID=652706 RepID=UPI0001BCB858|nr:primosomal protein N' [Oribacterium sp. oral taxon 078]EFE92853.1 primosomal protein N' [Oribacterium sp. oral taxon 078 str. F0262]